MSKKLYLHIGIWKTGTTTIQDTLFLNQDILLKHDICYPSISSNHTFLASAFHQTPDNFIVSKSIGLCKEELQKWHQKSLLKFEQELSKASKSIVSSEFLLELDSHAIERLKVYLEKFFDEIKVIVYIRHPIDHISSAINEQIKQGHYSLDKAYEIHSKGKEYTKVLRWLNIFGKDNMIARPFEKEQFRNQDLVDDFLSLVSPEETLKVKKIANQNVTLSYPAIEIANQLLKFAPSFSPNRANSDYLFNIKGIKYKVPKNVCQTLLDNSQEAFRQVQDVLDITFVKDYTPAEDITKDDIYSDDTIFSIAKEFNRISLENQNLKKEMDYLKAKLYLAQGDKDLANKHFQKAILLDRFDVYKDYAYFLCYNGTSKDDLTKALFYTKKALSIKPDKKWLNKLQNLIVDKIEQAVE